MITLKHELGAHGKKERRSAVDIVIDSIKNLLIEGSLKAGDLLPNENEISEQLGVSRGSTREALKILSAYGVVDIRRGNGTYVCNGVNQHMFTPLLFQILVQNRDFRELIEVRQMVEGALLEMATTYRSEADLLKIEAARDAFERAIEEGTASDNECRELDVEFHRCIAVAAHNSIVQEIYEFVIELFIPSMITSEAGVIETHRGITQSIRDQDQESGRQWLEKHWAVWLTRYKQSSLKTESEEFE